MKKYFIIILSSLFIFCSCSDVMYLADYALEEYAKYSPQSADDNLNERIYQRGTAGHIARFADIARMGMGESYDENEKSLDRVLGDFAQTLSSNEAFNKSKKTALFGVVFSAATAIGAELEYRSFEDKVKRYTDPNHPDYDEEEALLYQGVDTANRRIIFLEGNEAFETISEYRKAKYEEEFSEDLNEFFEMPLDEYQEMSSEKQQNIDIMILNKREKKKISSDNIPSSNNVLVENTVTSYEHEDMSEKLEKIDVSISNFAFDSSVLTEMHKGALKTIVECMQNNMNIKIKVIGHGCIIGGEIANYNVGLKRAESVKGYLMRNGIKEERIIVGSAGSTIPYSSNNNIEGRKENRRVTFEIIQ